MKKAITIIFAVCLLVSVFAMNAYAANGGTLTVSSTTTEGNPALGGSTVTLRVTLAGADPLDGMHFKIKYDCTAFEWDEEDEEAYDVGSQITNENVSYNEGTGEDEGVYDYVDFINTPKKKTEDMNGTVLTLKFNVLNTTATQAYPFTVTYDDDIMFVYVNGDSSNIEYVTNFTVNNGTVYAKHVHSPAPADDSTDWIVDDQPTCTETGSRHYVCTYVTHDVADENPIPKLNHVITGDNDDYQAPTCTKEGHVLTYTCTRPTNAGGCGKTYLDNEGKVEAISEAEEGKTVNVTIPASHGLSGFTYVPVERATSKKTGVAEHWVCNACYDATAITDTSNPNVYFLAETEKVDGNDVIKYYEEGDEEADAQGLKNKWVNVLEEDPKTNWGDLTLPVIPRFSGDVNDSGKIDAVDVSLLTRYVAGVKGITIVEANADVNDSGKIDAVDVSLLTRYVAGVKGITLAE